jgi:predicted acylesterase/phospholipase RssA
MSGPLGRIGLSLSGGGYRAAGFHLGALDVLARLDLLRDVAVVSTVSGGTLTGCRYALAAARGEEFGAFFRRTFQFLERTNVIASAVDILAGAGAPRRRTLIAGAARVYSNPDFLGNAMLGELMDARSHIEELFLNATEFRTGLVFRFQATHDRARIGNRRVSLPRALARSVLLADIVAASSCFPGGFEPFVFPDDFRLPPGTTWTRGAIPLMDGGVYDNQGTAALLLADERGTARGRRVDLFLISDTHQPRDPGFTVAPAGPPSVSVATVLFAARSVLGLAVVCVAALGFETAREVRDRTFTGWHFLTLVVPMLFIGGMAVTFRQLWRRIEHELRRRIPAAAVSAFQALGGLGVREVVDLVDVRIRSLVALTSHVFMTRVRNLGYERLYSRPAYEGRRVSNLIYELPRAGVRAEALGLAPSAAQRQLAQRCLALPTTLWVDDPTFLRDLVACGQSTTCFNLIEHLVKHPRPGGEALLARARALYDVLREDPWRLVGEHLG